MLRATKLGIIFIAIMLTSNFTPNPNIIKTSDERLFNLTNQNFKLEELISSGKVKVGVTPDSSYNLISEIISKANQSIYIEVYQFWSDDIFDLINQTVQSKPGLTIKVILENDTGKIGEINDVDKYNKYYAYKFYNLSQAGFNVAIKLEPTGTYHHGKIIIVDEKIALISSDNFVPTAFPKNPSKIEKIEYYTPSRGWVALVEDQTIVSYFTQIFNQDFADSIDYDPSLGKGIPPPNYGVLSRNVVFDAPIIDENATLKPVVSPLNSLGNISDIINKANHTILLEEMYIRTSISELIDLLVKAHNERNVTVIIILEDDYPGNYNDMVDYFKSLGFHVVPAFQSYTMFLHNKGIIIDDELVFVGSINWSEYAFTRNREFGVIIESRKIASFLREAFAFDWNNSLIDGVEPFDSDRDGLPNYYELEHGLDPNSTDTDGDGLSDYEEVYLTNTNPVAPDFLRLRAPLNNTYINTSEVVLEFDLVDKSGLGSVEIYINGTLFNTYSVENSYNITLTNLEEGAYLIEIILKDTDGLEAYSMKLVIYVDLTPPLLRILKPFNETTFAITENISLKWSVSDKSPVITKIYIDSKFYQDTLGTELNISIIKNKLKTGMHQIKVVSIDAAGNKAADSVTIYVSKPNLKSLKFSPNNNSKIYSKSIKMVVEIEIEAINITDVEVKTSKATYIMNLVNREGDLWIWEKLIEIPDNEPLTLNINTEFYNFTVKIRYNLETNPILVFLHQYREEIITVAVLIIVVIIVNLLKRK